jgi:hypothetical protein
MAYAEACAIAKAIGVTRSAKAQRTRLDIDAKQSIV